MVSFDSPSCHRIAELCHFTCSFMEGWLVQDRQKILQNFFFTWINALKNLRRKNLETVVKDGYRRTALFSVGCCYCCSLLATGSVQKRIFVGKPVSVRECGKIFVFLGCHQFEVTRGFITTKINFLKHYRTLSLFVYLFFFGFAEKT